MVTGTYLALSKLSKIATRQMTRSRMLWPSIKLGVKAWLVK